MVAEDTLAPAVVILLTSSNAEVGALEAAELYKESVARNIVLGVCEDCVSFKSRLAAIGVSYPDTPTLVKLILQRSGVPGSAIATLPDRVDGTEAAVRAVSSFVQRTGNVTIIVVTARTHTARVRWLLRRALPPGTTVLVRSSRFDDFSVDRWWHDRNQSREVAMEYLRWVHSVRLVFSDRRS